RDINARRLWKRTLDCNAALGDDPARIVASLQETFPEATFLIDHMPVRAMKDIERGGYLLRLNHNFRYSSVPKNGTWLEASSLMAQLYKEERALVRVYAETS